MKKFEAARFPVRQRLRAWQEFIGDHLAEVDLLYPADVPTARAFGGSLAVDQRDKACIGRVRGSHQKLRRTHERIRRAERETLLLTCVEQGRCRVSQDERTAELGPGEFCLYDSTRPYQIDVSGELAATIVMIDRSVARSSLAALEGSRAIRFSSTEPAGRLAFRFWRDLADQSELIDDARLDTLIRNGFGLIEAAASAPCTTPVHRYADLVLWRAKHFLADHASDSHLSLHRAANAAGVSIRRLQEIFQSDGTTVTRFLRDLRLAAARRQLEDGSSARVSIACIAAFHGFADQSQFNRDFKRAFGLAPGAFRDAAHKAARMRRPQPETESGSSSTRDTPPPVGMPLRGVVPAKRSK